MEKYLKTKECEAPHIISFTALGHLKGLYIVCDTKAIEVDVKGGLLAASLKLIATYYIFDLEYPKSRSMMLGLLQTFIMEEVYDKGTSQGFKMLTKEIRQKWDEFKYEN